MTVDPSPSRRFLSPLGVRLAAAFVTVALAAVTVLGVLSVIAARGEVSDLVSDIHAGDARSAAVAAARAYDDADGWDGVDLSAAVAVAARGQATLALADADGTLIAAPADEAAEMMASMHGIEIVDVPRDPAVTAPVVVDGEGVGTVALRFPASHLPTPERQARDAIARTIVAGGALATVVAVIVAVVVARRVSEPVTALTAAATALERGRRTVRVDRSDAPGELGILSSAFDRMAAAVEQEDRLRRQLVADVAHEVRTPLTILRGTTEGLVDEVLQPDASTLRSLHDEVLRLSQLVNDLETLAAADAAGLQLRRGPVDLAVVASEVIDAIAPVAAERATTLTQLGDPAPTVGDERRLHQIVVNLVTNAIRYSPEGAGVTVECGTLPGRDEVFLRVVDTGPGLSAEDLERAFDRFYRGPAAVGTEGSGVGLAIAADLAAAHGGRLVAANADPGGASFTLVLPART